MNKREIREYEKRRDDNAAEHFRRFPASTTPAEHNSPQSGIPKMTEAHVEALVFPVTEAVARSEAYDVFADDAKALREIDTLIRSIVSGSVVCVPTEQLKKVLEWMDNRVAMAKGTEDEMVDAVPDILRRWLSTSTETPE